MNVDSRSLVWSPTEPGCKGVWDSIACWERADVGEIVTIQCPRVLKTVFGRNGVCLIFFFSTIITLTYKTSLSDFIRRKQNQIGQELGYLVANMHKQQV